MEHQNLKLKVCGLRDTENIKDIIDVKPDYMGFIFTNHHQGMLEIRFPLN